MNIAVDYDETFTADPELFGLFIYHAQHRGHKVYIVTMRKENDFERLRHKPEGVEVIYTGRKAKKPFCEKRGIHMDIWIDDMPEWLIADSA